MPEFRYTVVDSNGQILNGVIEAENQDVCRKIISQRGLYCLNISPVSLASRSINIVGKGKIKLNDLSVFCRQFATMLVSGISVIKCLDILYTQAEDPHFKAVLKKVFEGVQRGQSLSYSFAAQNNVFPEMMINMVEAGEASGTLENVMERLSEHFEKSMKTNNKIKNALTYPLILGILTVTVVIILMMFVLPVFIQMFNNSGVELPAPTRLLITISNSLTSYWYVYLIFVCSAALIWINVLKSENGRLKWDRFKTKMPVIGKLNIIIISARFARTLSIMMHSGISLLKSLEITAKVLNNKYYEKCMDEIRTDIRRGLSISEATKKADVFPVMLTSMISIGEESGTLDDVLVKTAALYDEESDNAITKMIGLLEPLMIIIMALVVGFIIVSIIVPMFGMMKMV